MNPVCKKPARSSSPLVRQLFSVIDESGLSYGDIEAATGVSRVTLSYWKHGKYSPRWMDFENVAHFLKHDIRLAPAVVPPQAISG